MSFDLDNTLVDRDGAARAWWCARLPDATEDELAEVLVRDASGRSPRMELFGWACARFPSLGPSGAALWSQFREQVPEFVVPTDGIVALVDRVAARYPVAILTNGSSALQRRKIARAGLDRVERVVVSEELGVAKPHAGAFRAVVAALGVPAAGVLHVGDDPGLDVLGAVDAGLAACWVGSGWRHERPLPDGVPVLARVTELPSVLPC